MPKEYVQTMQATMLDHCPVSSYAEVSRIIQEELGKPPEDLFVTMEQTPLASASLAQVCSQHPSFPLQPCPSNIPTPSSRGLSYGCYRFDCWLAAMSSAPSESCMYSAYFLVCPHPHPIPFAPHHQALKHSDASAMWAQIVQARGSSVFISRYPADFCLHSSSMDCICQADSTCQYFITAPSRPICDCPDGPLSIVDLLLLASASRKELSLLCCT